MNRSKNSWAIKTLERTRSLRLRINALNECERNEPRLKEDAEFKRELMTSRSELAGTIKEVRSIMRRMDVPSQQLMAEILFIHGMSPEGATRSLGLSRSCYHNRFVKLIGEMDRLREAKGDAGRDA